MPKKDEFLEDVFKELLRQGHDLINHYIRAFSVFIVITGGLVKFALDNNSNARLKFALSILGLLCSLLGMLTVYFGFSVISKLRQDLDLLSNKLQISSFHMSVMALRYLVIIALGMVGVTLVGWLVILLS